MADVIMEGCEPYDWDFGDREYAWWLARWLTPEELRDCEAAFRRWHEAHERWSVRLRVDGGWGSWHGGMYWPWRARLWLVDALTWRLYRPVRRFYRLALERGGPPPGPSWKVRTDWGGA